MRIFCLFHRTPWPPDKGDKLRAWHLLCALASRHELDVGWFVDDPADRAAESIIAPLARAHAAIPLKRLPALLRGASSLASGGSLSVAWFRHRGMHRFVTEALMRGIDGAYVFSGPMAQYPIFASVGSPSRTLPFVTDFVDVDSLKWRDYAAHRRLSALSSLYACEGRRLAAFEGMSAQAAQAALFVSEAEAERFRAFHPDLPAGRVKVVENGVDADTLDPAVARPVAVGDGPLVVFTGRMDYPPNIDAVRWFVDHPWPALHAACPDLRFAIVGAAPTPTVRRLARRAGIIVTGRVADVRPWLARADIAIAPLRIARGVQNKLLEAMAMARPVVASPAALEGIDALPGEHLLCARSADEWIATIRGLLESPEKGKRMGEGARTRVKERYSWDAAGNRLLEIVETAFAGNREGRRP